MRIRHGRRGEFVFTGKKPLVDEKLTTYSRQLRETREGCRPFGILWVASTPLLFFQELQTEGLSLFVTVSYATVDTTGSLGKLRLPIRRLVVRKTGRYLVDAGKPFQCCG